MPAYNPLGRLKPSTSSFKGLVPSRARAWFKSETSRLRPNSELLTTRRIFPVKRRIVLDALLQGPGIDLGVIGQVQHLHGHGRQAIQLLRPAYKSIERGCRVIHGLDRMIPRPRRLALRQSSSEGFYA